MPSFILIHLTVLATVHQCHRQDRTGQDRTVKWSDSIRQTVLQALVTQKFTYSTIYGPVIKVISCKAILLPQTEGFNGIRQAAQMYTPYSISQLASTLYQCCPLVSRFQCTECQTCPGMSWAGHFFTLEIASSHVEIWTPSNTWFLGPTQVHIPNGILIGSAIFCTLKVCPADRLTDQTALMCSNTPHLASAR